MKRYFGRTNIDAHVCWANALSSDMNGLAFEDEGNAFAVHDLLAGLPLLGEQGGGSPQANYSSTGHETFAGSEDIFEDVSRFDVLNGHELDDFSPFGERDSLRWSNLTPLEPIQITDASASKDVHDDTWQTELSELQYSPPKQQLYTWEAFHSNNPPCQARPAPAFLSEAGSNAFDAALEEHSNVDPTRKGAGRIVQSGAMMRALFEAGLGRASMLFPLNGSGELEPMLQDARISGFSLDGVSEIVMKFVDTGNTVRKLRKFAQEAYSLSTSFPGQVALAQSAESVLDAVEESILDVIGTQASLVQIVQAFEQPFEAVWAVKILVEAAMNAIPRVQSLDSSSRNLRILENIFDFVVTHTGQSLLVEEIWKQILASVARPWLDTVAEDIGLNVHKAVGVRQASLTSLSKEKEPQRKPRFLSDADFAMLSDTQDSMLYLARSIPDHPLATPSNHLFNPPKLNWCLSWNDVERTEAHSKMYERNLAVAIERYSLGQSKGTPSLSPLMTHEQQVEPKASDLGQYSEADILQQQAVFNALPHLSEIPEDSIKETVLPLLNSSGIEAFHLDTGLQRLPYTLIPNLTISSLLHTQNYILSHVVLHSMLHTHNLRGYVQAHSFFSLFSSGLFATRLSDALFSTSLETTERRKNQLRSGGTMGLNLGGNKRRNWPPASSELQLALSGILNDCWQAELQFALDSGSTTFQLSHNDELFGTVVKVPGDLSFSVRTLSSEQIDEILSPHSLHALDFLRLSNSLPLSIRPIVTEKCQKNYDLAFAFLLRLLRITFTVSDQTPHDLRLIDRSRVQTNDRRNDVLENVISDELFATLQQLQHAASHFVRAISSHCALFAAEGPLAAFCRYLDLVADAVSSPVPGDCASSTPNPAPSLAQLATRHESVSATVAANLFVRRRQRNVATSLERCLEDVLLFGRCVRKCLAAIVAQSSQTKSDSEQGGEDGLPEPIDLWYTFREHVTLLAAECESLAQSDDVAQEQETSGAASAAALLLRLRGDGVEWF